ncbi:peptidase family protein [Mesotoga prima MesG1.Ag.4.2]|uniref:Peptidase family protein n=1 Tax=Mesotoga prima MesG1.Ag.4.2 TaxID=660470 RepID=I2F2T5_9BACT|nr:MULTISPECIES: M20/M25/M40 family metallo-hydrolase [Mesotoga]AFK06238.1 peptidase family protein [Mesotoga prima MesG1.Ag.4.2]PIJ62044.1 peptidase M42 [Mesotoga sp. H07.pep.5.3]
MKLKRLKELCELPGISGFEERVSSYIMEVVKEKVDSVWTDTVGNLIAVRKGNGKSSKRLMLLAHTDEVGLMVKKINEDGTLSFTNIGGVDPRVLIGKKVLVGENLTPGVIGFEAIHTQDPSSLLKTPNMNKLKIYLGYSRKEEASEKHRIGDPVSFDTPYKEIGDYAVAKSFDDRTGCEVLMRVLESLDEKAVDFDVYFAWVVQEEVGLRGSGVAAKQIKPDVALVFENTTAGDNPELPEYRWATSLGKGPVLTFAHSGLVLDKKILDTIVETAKNNSIEFQYKSRIAGGTDAARLAKVMAGVPSGVISTPSRYIHSPTSVINVNDFLKVVELATILVKEGKVLSR